MNLNRPRRRRGRLDYRNAHALGGAANGIHGTFERHGVEIRELDFSDLFDLRFRDLADLGFVRFGGTFGDVDGSLDEHRHRRSLSDERKAAVRIDGDHDRDDEAFLIFA